MERQVFGDFEQGLNSAVNVLRQTLSDSPHTYIACLDCGEELAYDWGKMRTATIMAIVLAFVVGVAGQGRSSKGTAPESAQYPPLAKTEAEKRILATMNEVGLHELIVFAHGQRDPPRPPAAVPDPARTGQWRVLN